MSIKAIQEGTHAGDYGKPLPNKPAAKAIEQTAKKVDERYGTDVKSKDSQQARALSSQLHVYTIAWSEHRYLFWADEVETLIHQGSKEIQSGNYYSAEGTLKQISKLMYGK